MDSQGFCWPSKLYFCPVALLIIEGKAVKKIHLVTHKIIGSIHRYHPPTGGHYLSKPPPSIYTESDS